MNMSMKTKEIIYTILSAVCAVVVITASIVAGFFYCLSFRLSGFRCASPVWYF